MSRSLREYAVDCFIQTIQCEDVHIPRHQETDIRAYMAHIPVRVIVDLMVRFGGDFCLSYPEVIMMDNFDTSTYRTNEEMSSNHPYSDHFYVILSYIRSIMGLTPWFPENSPVCDYSAGYFQRELLNEQMYGFQPEERARLYEDCTQYTDDDDDDDDDEDGDIFGYNDNDNNNDDNDTVATEPLEDTLGDLLDVDTA